MTIVFKIVRVSDCPTLSQMTFVAISDRSCRVSKTTRPHVIFVKVSRRG